jgi:nucleotide-binding universal stress UspA family protein
MLLIASRASAHPAEPLGGRPVRPAPSGGLVFSHVLLATDLSEASDRAHEAAATLAKTFGARLTVVHVCEAPAFALAATTESGVDLVSPCTDAPRAELGRLLWRLRKRSIHADGVLRVGVPWEQIVAVALDVHADVIVTGTHGRHGIAHAFHGSVAEKVVQEAPIPVLAVPQAPSEA